MNPTSGTSATIPTVVTDESAPPSNWRTALADLLSARIALVQLEICQVAQSGIKRGVLFAAGGILLMLAWIILVAGGIGAVSANTVLAWYWVALIVGGIHLLLAAILIIVAKRPGDPAFEHTKAEFKKDREWLANFQSPNRSDD